MPDHDRLLTRVEVEARCAIARTTIYRLMRCGQFPEPLKIGPRAVGDVPISVEIRGAGVAG